MMCNICVMSNVSFELRVVTYCCRVATVYIYNYQHIVTSYAGNTYIYRFVLYTVASTIVSKGAKLQLHSCAAR